MKLFGRLLAPIWVALVAIELLTCVLPENIRADNAGLVDGMWVMRRVEDRYEGDDVQEDMHLGLWVTRGGREALDRELEVRWMKKDFGAEDRLIVHFIAPGFAAGVTLLNIIKPYVDDERWLYFPAGPIIRRVLSSDEHSNFMGTDFTYYDLSEREPDEENHKLLRIEEFQGRNCYVVESTPKGPVGAGYARKLYWIDTERFIKLRIQYYHANGRFWKQYDTEDWQELSGIWTAHRITMEDFLAGHKTIIKRSNVRYNQNLTKDFFEPRFIDCVVYNEGTFSLIPFEKRPTRVLAEKRKSGGRGTISPDGTAVPGK